MMMKHFMRRLSHVALSGAMSTIIIGLAHASPSSIPFTISGKVVNASGTLTGDFKTLSGFSDTVFAVTGASGFYTDSADGIAGVITGVLPGIFYTSIPNTGNHDSIYTTGVAPFPGTSFDNIVYPHGNSDVECYGYVGGQLDIFGLMFTLNLNNSGKAPGQAGGIGLVNLWSNGVLNDPTNNIGLDYGVSDGLLLQESSSAPANGQVYYALNYIGNTNNYPNNIDGTGLYTPSGVWFSTPNVPEPSALMMLGSGITTLSILGLRRKKRA